MRVNGYTRKAPVRGAVVQSLKVRHSVCDRHSAFIGVKAIPDKRAPSTKSNAIDPSSRARAGHVGKKSCKYVSVRRSKCRELLLHRRAAYICMANAN